MENHNISVNNSQLLRQTGVLLTPPIFQRQLLVNRVMKVIRNILNLRCQSLLYDQMSDISHLVHEFSRGLRPRTPYFSVKKVTRDPKTRGGSACVDEYGNRFPFQCVGFGRKMISVSFRQISRINFGNGFD